MTIPEGTIRLEPAPEALSLKRLARLVEIAYETHDLDIKRAALAVLNRALNPMFIAVPTNV